MLITRAPRPSLRPFVSQLWASHPAPGAAPSVGVREHTLPTGAMHLVFRLSGPPLRVFDDAGDLQGRTIGPAVVGGARSAYYIRDVSRPSVSVGAMLRPGAAELLFGATAEELSQRHTDLGDLWGRSAGVAYERLLAAGSPGQRLKVLESVLAERLAPVHGLHPVVAYALVQFNRSASVDAVVQSSGYSHRHFIAHFRRAVGLTPKVYGRVLRFRRALSRLARGVEPSLIEIALEAGYSDQAHFSRDFMAFAGVAPSAYRRIAPAFPSHVTLPVDRPRA